MPSVLGMPPFSSEKVLWATVHKARLYLSCIDDEGRELSRKWLVENGFTPGVSSPPFGSEKSNILRGILGKKK